MLSYALPTHFKAPAIPTLPIAHSATSVGSILHSEPIPNFAPARPHSSAISPIFAIVASFLPAHTISAHFFNTPTLFGQTIDPAICVHNSPAFALVVVGS